MLIGSMKTPLLSHNNIGSKKSKTLIVRKILDILNFFVSQIYAKFCLYRRKETYPNRKFCRSILSSVISCSWDVSSIPVACLL